MAKRKRLTPARIDTAPGAAPEVKSALTRPPLGARPPIADVAQDAAATAAFSEVAQELQNARTQERLIQPLKIDSIVDDYLVRDRTVVDSEELAVLVDSLRKRGQQTAIEVASLGDGRYGLISGFRRLAALRLMGRESPEIDTVLAIVRHPADSAAAYQAMVEENEIRVGLSFYERGRIVARAVDQGVFRNDRIALGELFHAVPRARRSKIGSFVTLVRALDDVLRFPTGITEKQGLMLAKLLDEDTGAANRLRAMLMRADAGDATAEGAVIARALSVDPAPEQTSDSAVPTPQRHVDQSRMKADRVENAAMVDADADDDLPLPGDLAQDLQTGLSWIVRPGGHVVLRGDKLSDRQFLGRLKLALKALR